MGIIYMDFYYNRWDDMILSMSPLILLFFITQVDDVLKYLIVAMIMIVSRRKISAKKNTRNKSNPGKK